ncbi:MAG: TolC family protein [Steroidobacteraceae bacterium]
MYRHRLALLQAAFVALLAVGSPPTPGVAADIPDSAELLTMAEAARLAMVDQPLLSSREAAIEAAQQQAIAAAQLPDPKLSGALRDVPIDTAEAFSLRRDNFTEYTVGLSQEFPRAEKRRLKGERKERGAQVDRAALDNDRRTLRRDASLAWLDVYEAEQALKLARRVLDQAELQWRSTQKEYAAGRASQADWFASKIEAALVGDKAHDWLHHTLRSREALARWVGAAAARRPLADSPQLPAQPGRLAYLLDRAEEHPLIQAIDRQIDASTTDVALARQAYKPDFSVEVYTAYRRDFADFVGVQVTVGLPYFMADRQDRELAGALQLTRAGKERKRDALRELRAQVGETYVDWQHYAERVANFDALIVPDAARRADAARSAYAAGSGPFEAVLLARRSQLEVELQRLNLAVESARAQVRLEYLTP